MSWSEVTFILVASGFALDEVSSTLFLACLLPT
jgi:hypothetical protein